MAIALTHSTSYTGFSSSLNVSLGYTPTNGRLLIAAVTVETGNRVTSITQNNVVWKRAAVMAHLVGQTSYGARNEIWYGRVISTGASSTVTVNQSNSGYAAVGVYEYSGLAASGWILEGVNNNAHGNCTSALSSGKSAPPSTSSSLHFGMVTIGSTSPSLTTGGGFTALHSNVSNAYHTTNTGHLITSSTSTQEMAVTSSSTGYAFVGCIATFSATALTTPAIEKVQILEAPISSSSSKALTMDATPTTGNVLAMFVGGNDSALASLQAMISGITQTGVTWRKAHQKEFTGVVSYNPRHELWIGVVGASPSANLTVDFNAFDDWEVLIMELSGVDPDFPLAGISTSEDDGALAQSNVVGVGRSTSQLLYVNCVSQLNPFDTRYESGVFADQGSSNLNYPRDYRSTNGGGSNDIDFYVGSRYLAAEPATWAARLRPSVGVVGDPFVQTQYAFQTPTSGGESDQVRRVQVASNAGYRYTLGKAYVMFGETPQAGNFIIAACSHYGVTPAASLGGSLGGSAGWTRIINLTNGLVNLQVWAGQINSPGGTVIEFDTATSGAGFQAHAIELEAGLVPLVSYLTKTATSFGSTADTGSQATTRAPAYWLAAIAAAAQTVAPQEPNNGYKALSSENNYGMAGSGAEYSVLSLVDQFEAAAPGNLQVQAALGSNTNWAAAAIQFVFQEKVTNGATLAATSGLTAGSTVTSINGGLIQATSGLTAGAAIHVFNSAAFAAAGDLSADSLIKNIQSATLAATSDLQSGWLLTKLISASFAATSDVQAVASVGYAPMQQAVNPDPFNTETGVDPTKVLSWDPVWLATSYQVYFGTNATDVANGTGGTDKGSVGTESYDPPGDLTPGDTYYWRIDAYGPGEHSTGSVWSFTVAPLPAKASNPDPTDGDITDIPFTQDLGWSTDSWALQSRVYFGTDGTAVTNAGTGDPEYKGSQATVGVGSWVFEPGDLTPGQDYYWRIDVEGLSGVTKGDTWFFHAEDPPTKATLDLPGEASEDNQRPVTLQWFAGIEADTYDVYVGTNYAAVLAATQASPEFKGNVAALAFDTSALGLTYGTTYYWRVDSVGDGGTRQGDVWSFVTELPDVGGTPDPLDEEADVPQTKTLAWEAGQFVDTFDVYFGDVPILNASHRVIFAQPAGDPREFTPPALLLSQTYYWRVDGRNGAGLTQGPTWSFTVEDPTPMPVSQVGANGEGGVGGAGGTLLRIHGDFAGSAGKLFRAYIGPTASVYDTPCYSGRPGRAFLVSPKATYLDVYTPDLAPGLYSFYARQTDGQAVIKITKGIPVLPRQYGTRTWSFRSVFPPTLDPGPRRADRLAAPGAQPSLQPDAPVVTPGLLVDQTVVAGTSGNDLATIQVYVNGNPEASTVVVNGSWSVDVRPLTAGQVVTAKAFNIAGESLISSGVVVA